MPHSLAANWSKEMQRNENAEQDGEGEREAHTSGKCMEQTSIWNGRDIRIYCQELGVIFQKTVTANGHACVSKVSREFPSTGPRIGVGSLRELCRLQPGLECGAWIVERVCGAFTINFRPGLLDLVAKEEEAEENQTGSLAWAKKSFSNVRPVLHVLYICMYIFFIFLYFLIYFCF